MTSATDIPGLHIAWFIGFTVVWLLFWLVVFRHRDPVGYVSIHQRDLNWLTLAAFTVPVLLAWLLRAVLL